MSTLQPSLRTENGNVARGWRRWVRARDAAYAKPHTQAAELYFARLKQAESFDANEVVLRRVAHWYNGKTDYYLCSDFCAKMQAMLENKTIYATIWSLQAVGIWPADLTRKITCHVCRRKVFPKTGLVDNTHRIQFRNPEQVIADVPRRAPRKHTRVYAPAVRPQPQQRQTALFEVTVRELEALCTFLETWRRVHSEDD